MGSFEWYSSYPSQCPPIEAIENSVSEAYRLVAGCPLHEAQFFPNNMTINQIVDYSDCQRWGVTFFSSLEGLIQLRNKVAAFRKSHWKYAKGEIKQEFGKLIITDDHINLWRYKYVVIHASFRIVP